MENWSRYNSSSATHRFRRPSVTWAASRNSAMPSTTTLVWRTPDLPPVPDRDFRLFWPNSPGLTLQERRVRPREKVNTLTPVQRRLEDGRLSSMSVVRLLFPLISAIALLAQPVRRPIKPEDLARMHELRDPQCSPDGRAVAYEVSTIDVKEDKSNSHIWMVS